MDAHDHHGPQSPRPSWQNVVTNWNQPLPFRVKLSKLLRNLWVRVATGSNCCGHPGEPGC